MKISTYAFIAAAVFTSTALVNISDNDILKAVSVLLACLWCFVLGLIEGREER